MGAPVGSTTAMRAYIDARDKQVRTVFDTSTYGYDQFKKLTGPDAKWGKNSTARFTTHLRRSYPFGWRDPGNNLPSELRVFGDPAATQTARTEPLIEEAEVEACHIFAQILADGDVVALSAQGREGQRQALDAITLKRQIAREGMQRLFEALLWGDGSAELARVSVLAATNATAVVLRGPEAGFADEGQWGLTWLSVGMFIVFVDPLTGLRLGGSYRITALNPATRTITVTPPLTADVTVDARLVEGDNAGNSFGAAFLGFESAISTSDDVVRYLTINRDQHERWEGTEIAAAVGDFGDLTPALVRRAMRISQARGNRKNLGAYVTFIHSALWDEPAYGVATGAGGPAGNDINANRRYMNESVKVGVREFDWVDPSGGNIRVVETPTGRPNRVYGIPRNAARFYILQDWKTYEGYAIDGTFRMDENIDRWTSRMGWRGNLAFTDPAACFKITGCRQRNDGVTGLL